MKTAILVDGAFYRKRAYSLWGDKSPEERAKELFTYCLSHLNYKGQYSDLYRIFYYDCSPVDYKVYHPLLKKTVDLKKTETYTWTSDFFEELRCQRKLALRLGKISIPSIGYVLKAKSTKKLLNGNIKVEELMEDDFSFQASQKGVDMKIGLDIASLAYKKQVDQIILISGDSDFVSAAKLARREGIDFILDPMWANINPDLNEHIDGLRSAYSDPKDFKIKKYNKYEEVEVI